MIKNAIVKLIKKVPFLYNLAKKVVNKKNKSLSYNNITNNDVYYIYIMKQEEELNEIKQHYDEIKKENSKLAIIVDDKDSYNYMHKIIRENINISFMDLQYFKTYNKKINVSKYILLDYKSNQYNKDIFEYVM